MATIVIVGILSVIVVAALISSRKHLKGQGGCCGGDCNIMMEEPKNLEGPVVGKRILHIEGMHCANCVNSVTRALQRIDGVSAKVNLKNKTAEVTFDREILDEDLMFAVKRLDYQVTAIDIVG